MSNSVLGMDSPQLSVNDGKAIIKDADELLSYVNSLNYIKDNLSSEWQGDDVEDLLNKLQDVTNSYQKEIVPCMKDLGNSVVDLGSIVNDLMTSTSPRGKMSEEQHQQEYGDNRSRDYYEEFYGKSNQGVGSRGTQSEGEFVKTHGGHSKEYYNNREYLLDATQAHKPASTEKPGDLNGTGPSKKLEHGRVDHSWGNEPEGSLLDGLKDNSPSKSTHYSGKSIDNETMEAARNGRIGKSFEQFGSGVKQGQDNIREDFKSNTVFGQYDSFSDYAKDRFSATTNSDGLVEGAVNAYGDIQRVGRDLNEIGTESARAVGKSFVNVNENIKDSLFGDSKIGGAFEKVYGNVKNDNESVSSTINEAAKSFNNRVADSVQPVSPTQK